MRKNVCPNIEAGELMCADGKTKVADFGFNLLSTLSYSVQFTSANFVIFNCSCSQAFMAGNLHAVELSSKIVSFSRASIVALSSFFALVLPLRAKKNLL